MRAPGHPRREPGHERRPLLLLRDASNGLSPDRGPDRGEPNESRGQDRHREALRARSRERPGTERGPPPGVRRVADLPDRPLPRQGNRPEHPGLPVRQRHRRAHLEPALRRQRADHGGRGDRHRGQGRVLRADGGAARHGEHPPVPGADVPGHGAAGLVRAEPAPGREGEGAPGDARVLAGARGARAVRGLPQ